MISVRNVTKVYTSGVAETYALRGVDLDIKEGEFVAIMGKSGAGKSTLLYQMSLLDRPTDGSITINDVDVLSLSDRERTSFRLLNLGYVFQDYALLPELSALENIIVPLLMMGWSRSVAEDKARDVLESFGLLDRVSNLPSQLSGGEQQRVSVARAIAQEPSILFADEPTANLDTVSAKSVLSLLNDLHRDGQTIVMVTHESDYALFADRIVYLSDGLIVREKKNSHTHSRTRKKR